MGWILDLIVLLIIGVCALVSAKRGFIKVLIETLGFIIAIALAFTISTPLSNATYDKMIEPAIMKSVSQATQGVTDSQDVAKVWDSLPEYIKTSGEKLGISLETFQTEMANNAQNGFEAAILSTSQRIIKPVIANIIGMIFTLIIFIILMFVAKLLAGPINKLFSFSIIGKLNRTLGGVLGIVKGVIYAVAVCMAISVIVSLTENGFLFFTTENIANSHIFKFFTNIVPFTII